jgi:alpha-mannosidase
MQAVTTGANPRGTLPAPTASLIEIAEPNILLVGLKRAEADQGLVLRLWEVTGQATTAHVRLPLVPFRKARAASLVEEPKESLEVRDSTVAVPIRGCGLATVLLD